MGKNLILVLIMIVGLFFADQAWSWQGPLQGERSPAVLGFQEEVFYYDIGFMTFDRVGRAEFSFQKAGKGRYRVMLDAGTVGLAARVSGNRRQTYQTLMEIDPVGRYRTLRFEYERSKMVAAGRDVLVKRYDFDYDRRVIRYVRIKNGREGRTVDFSMGEGVPPADFLTNFVNFRSGFYGRPVPERPLVVPTFSRGAASQIRIEVVDPSVSKQKEFFRECPGLFRVVLNPEVFDTGGGDVFVCLGASNQPLSGAVENVLGFGDVLGKMRQIAPKE